MICESVLSLKASLSPVESVIVTIPIHCRLSLATMMIRCDIVTIVDRSFVDKGDLFAMFLTLWSTMATMAKFLKPGTFAEKSVVKSKQFDLLYW